MSHIRFLAPLLLTSGLLTAGLPSQALAARSYDNCTGYITSLPASISTQGTWCLRADVSSSVAGAAINIVTNNVTLDCNDFKVGGLAAGAGTQATGVQAMNRANVTVRNCNVRGFRYGVWLSGSGHLVEDNRLDGNTSVGILVGGDGGIVRGNRVLDTGGGSASPLAAGVLTYGSVDVINNTVQRVVAGGAGFGARNSYGIYLDGNLSGQVGDNRVRGVNTTESTYGIYSVNTGHVAITNNDLLGGTQSKNGVVCDSASAVLVGNIVAGFDQGVTTCTLGAGNDISL